MCGKDNIEELEVMDEIINHINSLRKKEELRQNKFGLIKPIISAEMNESKFVVVANRVYYSKQWKTFPDFLRQYIWGVLGRNFFENEASKPFEKKHQIYQWYIGMINFQSEHTSGKDGIHSAVPNGLFMAFLLLAYDLYILRHHKSLQNYVIERLKKPESFQGARYELFVTSACIKSGFDILFENESDYERKHVEFIAVHKKTGEKIAVEAKSRHFPGILGHPGEKLKNSALKLRIAQLVNRAVKKNPDYPLIVFIDLNVPGEYQKNMFPSADPMKNFRKPFDNIIRTADGKDIFNMICLTNHPLHYNAPDQPAPKVHLSVALANKPKMIINNSAIIDDIIKGLLLSDNIPNEINNPL